MENIIKTIPEVGDFVIIIDGKKRFVRGAEATSTFLNSHDCVGMVYDVQGKLVRIVGGINNVTRKWSSVVDYEITAIPQESGDYAVKLNNAELGNFHYEKTDGTIAEFAEQLNTWLAAMPAGSIGLRWEAYTNSGHSYLQMSTYDTFESTNTIAGTTLVKLTGTELAGYIIKTVERNHIKQYVNYNGMNRERMDSHCRTNTKAECNPTTEMDGVTKLFANMPVSKAYYDGALGGSLRSHFATYDLYLDACMVIPEDLDKGIMKFRDGRLMTSLLSEKKLLVYGVETYAYPAAGYALGYDTNISGFRAGDYWLPSMYELVKLMAVAGILNANITKKTGWTELRLDSTKWSCCMTDIEHARCYDYRGLANNNGLYLSYSCSAVSAFELD